MRRSTARALACALVLAAVTAAAPSARAQAGWYATPSFSLTEEYDDNVFATPSEERDDFITRFSPGLKLGFRSATLTLEAGYSLDAEIYAKNPELGGETNRQRAGLELKYPPSPLATLGLSASYIETQTPAELVVETGVDLGRREASQLTVAPTFTYRFSPVMTAEAGYVYMRARIEEGAGATTHEARLGLTYQLTPLDAVTLGYRGRLFESQGADSVVSHTPTLGWSGRPTQSTTLTLQAGPRFSDGTIDAEALARLEHRFRYAALSLAYVRTEAVLLGRTAPVTTDGLAGLLTLDPVPSLRVTLAPSVRRSREEAADAAAVTVYGVGLAVSYRLAAWLTARAEYRFALQEEEGGDRIRHTVASVSLDFRYPVRFDE